MRTLWLWSFVFLLCPRADERMSMAQEANYDEAKIPPYELPDLLLTTGGEQVTTAEQWLKVRRPELLRLFEEQMFGRAPSRPVDLHWQITDEDQAALAGRAIRKQVTIYFSKDRSGPRMDLLLWLPKSVSGPVPVFLGLNFVGNHGTHPDPAIRLTESWMRDDDKAGVVNNLATEQSRGRDQSSWPVAEILARGYGLGTIYYGDIDPDFDDQFQNGVHQLYHGSGRGGPTPEQWGSIATWAWGLSRALDYLQTEAAVDAKRVAVVGHSRLGKTAMWAGAIDERFALVISNNSGCGGAALSRRRIGETVQRINTVFPHWFCDNFTQYNGREDELPFDQHGLVALVAPRPILITSAEEDRWADPRGEFLSAFHASPVYELLGQPGIAGPDMPPMHQLSGGRIGYFIRAGEHAMTKMDWEAYLEFADRNLVRSTQ
ncbi:MAG: acetylxylan esterase [Planctomycetaceae bacterium]|nr:acetylxylan esterase [Planctomycetaceae bacterium]